ncbi:hypothetical protein [Vibrio sp. D431a]|uniref:hypothetical protein n=1 Tax=Vibrio sp. D431a TaxID=2837388 RepID=UPI0025576252|nr:hypothetical protein [Vibrio sp. D431a]MDK9790071.1 hypothetical protein [Vibrio sp. D431a]
MSAIDKHKFKVITKYCESPERGVEISIGWFAKDSNASSRTTSFVSFEKPTITRPLTEVYCMDELNGDPDEPTYDEVCNLAIHSACWEHNLIALAYNCGGLEQLEESICEMFEHTAELAASGKLHEMHRYNIYDKNESILD